MKRFQSINALTLVLLFNVSILADDLSNALEIFKKRITPILKSDNPSSCTQCHLSGVDLKNYIGETQEETFAALQSEGLIDSNNPDRSKILEFIQRGSKADSPIGQDVRKVEYEAFRSWIHAAVKDPKLASVKTDVPSLGTKLPPEVIRHTRMDRVLKSFVENIWSEKNRCVSCHQGDLNRKMIGNRGMTKEDVDAFTWIEPNNPAKTLQNLIDTENIDIDDPDASPVLTKPLGIVKHGGGPKFLPGGRTDQNYRRFLHDYANSVKGTYEMASDLPTPPSMAIAPTQRFLRIMNMPEEYHRKMTRVDLYRWLGDKWSEQPFATSDNPIAGKRQLWQGPMFATAPRNSERAAYLHSNDPLPVGSYKAKIYIDKEDRTKEDRDFVMGESELFAEVQFAGRWQMGFKNPKIVRLPLRDGQSADAVTDRPKQSDRKEID